MPAEFPIEHLSPAALLAHPLNWGKHSAEQKGALAYSLGRFGWLKPVIVNSRTGRIIDGHARVEQAKNVGADTIPCRVVDVDEATEREMLAVIDRVGEMRERDEGKLLALLQTVTEDRNGEPPAGWEGMDLSRLAAAVPETETGAFGGRADDLPFEDGLGDDAGGDAFGLDDAPALPVETHVRQVQLFLDGSTHPEFMELCDGLQSAFQTETLTDTVLEAIRYAHHQVVTRAE